MPAAFGPGPHGPIVFARGSSGWSGPSSGLTHRWPMDDDNVSGASIVDVVAALNGTGEGGGVGSGAGPSGGSGLARTFNGTHGITLPSSAVATFNGGNFSIGFWVKVTDITAAGNGGFRATFLNFEVNGSDGLRALNNLNLGNGFVGFSMHNFAPSTAAAQLVNATWVHVVLTSDGAGTDLIYINGSSVSRQTGATDDFVNGSNRISGLVNGGSTQGIPTGSMAQIVVYSKILSSGEVTQLYNAF